MAYSFPFNIHLSCHHAQINASLFRYIEHLFCWICVCHIFMYLIPYLYASRFAVSICNFFTVKGKTLHFFLVACMNVDRKRSTGVDFLDFVISFFGFHSSHMCRDLCHVVNVVDTFTHATKSTNEKLNG